MTDEAYVNARLRFAAPPALTLELGAQYALANVVDKLRTEPDAVARLAGFRFALAIVENAYITTVQSNTMNSMKLAAKNGVDLNTHQLASVKAEVVAVPLDLVELAASVDTLPKGQDAKQGLAGTEGSAVPNEDSADAQPSSSKPSKE